MIEGTAKAKTLVISWVEEDEGMNRYCYIVGGGQSLSDAVGLLEITKSSVITLA